MKKLALLLLSIASYGVELIYVSNDSAPQNLQLLSEKYKQPLLINGSDIYLIPKACRLERYFGGASEGEVNRTPIPMQTESIALTQEVFDAKDERTILKKIEVEKSIALIEGKVPKAFLEDKDGRGFGGASEMLLDFAMQKNNEVIHATSEVPSIEENGRLRPSCQMLKNGSGYILQNTTGAQFYSNKGVTPIIDDTILFK